MIKREGEGRKEERREKDLGTLEMVLQERRRRNGIFPKLLGLQGSKCTSDYCSRKWKRRAHSRRLLKDPNGQIVGKCYVKLQTKFREDPTVNEGWEAFLPRRLHVAFS